MLDVQILAEVCGLKGRRLKYLGFDQSLDKNRRSTQRIAAEQIVHQSQIIADGSDVVPDNICSIANPTSLGNRSLRDGGSYDVVNLDMCDAFTSHPESPTHAAMLELLTHQSNHRAEPWLLFITTRSEIQRLQISELDVYHKVVADNSSKSPLFKEAVFSLAPGYDKDREADDILTEYGHRLASDTFLSGRWLAIGIGKWLLGITSQKDPWRVDLLSIYAYRTGLLSAGSLIYAGEPPNLFSLVFRFEKIRLQREDPSGLAQPASTFSQYNEVLVAEKLVKAVSTHTKDLDGVMQAELSTHAQLAAECSGLLADRYYSPSAYQNWVRQLPRITC